MRRERWIQFFAKVNAASFGSLVNILQSAVVDGMERLHLLLSTPGGAVSYGLTLYAVLRGLPLEVWTYNVGQVDSIGIVLYCAGKRRLAAPQTRFLLHEVALKFDKGYYPLRHLRERLVSIESDQRNICRIVAEVTGQAAEKIERDMTNNLTLLAEEAQTYRLVDDIVTEIVPPQAHLTTIFVLEEEERQMNYGGTQ